MCFWKKGKFSKIANQTFCVSRRLGAMLKNFNPSNMNSYYTKSSDNFKKNSASFFRIKNSNQHLFKKSKLSKESKQNQNLILYANDFPDNNNIFVNNEDKNSNEPKVNIIEKLKYLEEQKMSKLINIIKRKDTRYNELKEKKIVISKEKQKIRKEANILKHHLRENIRKIETNKKEIAKDELASLLMNKLNLNIISNMNGSGMDLDITKEEEQNKNIAKYFAQKSFQSLLLQKEGERIL